VRDKKAVAELFDNKVSEFSNRAGGYTRIYKLGQRVGDAAEMGLIELIDANDEGYPKRPKKEAAKSETKAKAKAEPEVEEVAEEVVEAEAETTEVSEADAGEEAKKD
jgi:large subunit ribosomal protein L17